MPLLAVVTDVFPSPLVMSVPVGNVTVIVLTPWRDSPPVDEVVNPTK